MTVQDQAADDLLGSGYYSYSGQAALLIAEAERIGALQLPEVPDDPVAAAAMRASGYQVLAECRRVEGDRAFVSLMGDDEEDESTVPAAELAEALGATLEELPGVEFLAFLRETLEEGRVLSRFRCLPAVA
jgi:hypothetical protein